MSLIAHPVVSVAGIAVAQTARLSAEGARASFMASNGANASSREATPSIAAVVKCWKARLEIRPDGQACFNYPPDTCWSRFGVVREGENYRLDDFVTRTVRRNVRECDAANGAYARLGADS